ncbi:MAG: hypothetical protein KGZ62_10290 [Sulfurimonas sp.]|nr:hypothetical protein [Sulfurimonas sp.]
MNIVKIIINYPGRKAVKKELNISGYFEIEEKLVDNIAKKGGRLRVFLDGWQEIKAYPEKIIPVENDKILSVILDKGDAKKSFELYETEFEVISEIWREKKWGFSALDLLGNTVALLEYDYIHRLQEAGKVYDANSSRRIYSIDHDKEINLNKGFFKEIAEGLKKDYGWLFGFSKRK